MNIRPWQQKGNMIPYRNRNKGLLDLLQSKAVREINEPLASGYLVKISKPG